MKILAIDTSCDETAAAVVSGRRVLSNVIYSQILIHRQWGGVVPSLAKRAHQEKIDFVIRETLKRSGNLTMKDLDAIAVTRGPGLAVALEVGIKKAIELAKRHRRKLISVNHLEGHIYSPFVENRKGNPDIEFNFPYLALVISGGHTEFAVFKNHLRYEIIGRTLDDAAGEALDKAAKLLGLGYPGGPAIERLAKSAGNDDTHRFPRPMLKSGDLNFSFSGLKTSFYYFLHPQGSDAETNLNKKGIAGLASSFQEAVFDTILKKSEAAVKRTGIKRMIIGGGVSANLRLRLLMRRMIRKFDGEVLFPSYKYLTGDNAAMIGTVASFKAEANDYVRNPEDLDRLPRMSL